MRRRTQIYAAINLATSYGVEGENWSEVKRCNVENPLALFEQVADLGGEKFLTADTFFGKPYFNYEYARDYIASKDQFANQLKAIASKRSVFCGNLRLEHVFGPNDGQRKFVSRLISDFRKKKRHIDLTTGTQKRDFIYVPDVSSAFIKVLMHNQTGNYVEYEVGTGKSITLKSFCLELAKAFSVSTDRLRFGAISQRRNEIMDSKADIRALSSIGWAARWSLRPGVVDLAAKQDRD
jgi:nucleoside-diphosphate-sugar epimerase